MEDCFAYVPFSSIASNQTKFTIPNLTLNLAFALNFISAIGFNLQFSMIVLFLPHFSMNYVVVIVGYFFGSEAQKKLFYRDSSELGITQPREIFSIENFLKLPE